MSSLNQLILEIQKTMIDALNLNLKDLPVDFYETPEQQLLIKTKFPSDLLKEITKSFPVQWQTQIQAHTTQLPGFAIKNIKNAIAVVSGKGGVGKSTISCNLACATALLGAKVGLLDADIYGPSLPTMMGIEEKPSCLEDNRYQPLTAHLVECMSMGLLQSDGPLIWRGPMLAKALLQMLDQTAWSKLDYLFIDLPPGTGDIPLSLTQKIPLAGAVIVTTPQTIATLDAEKALQMFLKLNIPVLGIIANMAWHECENCQHHSPVFGAEGAKELAERYQVPLLGELPLHRHIRETGDTGAPIACEKDSSLGRLWQQIALNTCIELGKKPINHASKIPLVRKE